MIQTEDVGSADRQEALNSALRCCFYLGFFERKVEYFVKDDELCG